MPHQNYTPMLKLQRKQADFNLRAQLMMSTSTCDDGDWACIDMQVSLHLLYPVDVGSGSWGTGMSCILLFVDVVHGLNFLFSFFAEV